MTGTVEDGVNKGIRFWGIKNLLLFWKTKGGEDGSVGGGGPFPLHLDGNPFRSVHENSRSYHNLLININIWIHRSSLISISKSTIKNLN